VNSNPFPGTTFDKTNKRWKARARIDGVKRNLGYYATQEEAYAAVQEALLGKPQERAVDVAPVDEAIATSRKNTKIAQSNLLVEAHWPFTLFEARLFVLMLRCLHKNDDEAPAIVIPLEDLMPGQRGGYNYELLKQALKKFMELRFDLPVDNTRTDMASVNLVQGMALNAKQGVVMGAFTPLALPYLTRLTSNFVVADVAELLSLKTVASFKMYWLMKSWQFRSPVTVSVDRLRDLTTKGQYAQYSDYRARILHPSIEELNGMSFEIDFTENRKGRVVDSLEFRIAYRQDDQPAKQLPPASEKPTPQLTDMQQKVVTRLTKLKLTQAQIKTVLNVVVGEEQLTKLLKETFPILRDHETKAKPNDNVAASTMTLLKNTFPAYYKASTI
jgi:plasmid replication initiation protein